MRFLPGILTFALGWMVALSARTWTPADGSPSFEAELVSFRHGTVILQMTDGSKTLRQIDTLSPADRDFIRAQFPAGDARETAGPTTDYSASGSPAPATSSPAPAAPATPSPGQGASPKPAAPLPHLANVKIGDFPPDLTLYPQGQPEGFALRDRRGKPILLTFWNPRETSSQQIMQFIVTLHKKYEPLGLQVFSVGREANRPSLKQMEKQLGITWPSAQDRNGSIAKTWGLRFYPTLVFIDPTGRVVRDNLQPGEVEALLRPYFGSK